MHTMSPIMQISQFQMWLLYPIAQSLFSIDIENALGLMRHRTFVILFYFTVCKMAAHNNWR